MADNCRTTILFLVIFMYLSTAFCKLPPPKCLSGEFHKRKPGPETTNYQSCHAYKENTCCTADFTKQLSTSPVKIGNFSWNTCAKPFSTKCQFYMKEIECFYQCSPNVGYFKGQFPGSFVGVPICGAFCDAWFDACKDDETCATNWVTDFDYLRNKENKCKRASTCRSFKSVYGNGTGLCNKMWGLSFKFKATKKANDCMHLNSSNVDAIKRNALVAEKYTSAANRNQFGLAGIIFGMAFSTYLLLWV